MRYLVTGGGGFLGLEIVRRLRARGDEVVSYSRTKHPAVEQSGAQSVQGNLTDELQLAEAMRGCDGVFHVAAKAGIWGSKADYAHTNIAGTLSVVRAVRAAGISKLVHTSSPSVCFDGRDHLEADNRLPLALETLSKQSISAYAWSKAEAEQLVQAAHGPELTTVILRPHLIFGHGDPHLLPRVAMRAQRRKLFAVGTRTNRVSLCHVTNAAHAHVQAMDRLHPAAAHAGQAYFINQTESVCLWDWLDQLCRELHWPTSRGPIPLWLARSAGALAETCWSGLGLRGEPPITRFTAMQLALSHTYSMMPAQRDFGYQEQVDLAAATADAVRWLREVDT